MIKIRLFTITIALTSMAGCVAFAPRSLPTARTPAEIAKCDLPTSTETFSVKHVQVSLRTLTHPYRMEIIGAPFGVRTSSYGRIINARYSPNEDPLSDRKHWAKAPKIIPRYKEDAHVLFPELFAEERFSATLSLEQPSEQEWAKLGYVLGQEPLLAVSILPKIWKFAHVSAKCFGQPRFSSSVYGKFAQRHLEDLLLKKQEELLSKQQNELLAALESDEVHPIQKLRYYGKTIGKNPLIITHPSRQFDPDMISKPATDKLIAQARSEKRQIVYLMQYDNVEDITQFYLPQKGDLVMYSSRGEHSFTPANNHATVIGNFFGLCQGSAIEDVITRYFVNRASGVFTVSVPLAASATHMQDVYALNKTYTLITVDDYLKRTNAESFKKLVEKYFLKPTHFGSDQHFFYGPAPEYKMLSTEKYRVSYKDYTFTVLLDGKELLSRGTGPRHVRLEFLSQQ